MFTATRTRRKRARILATAMIFAVAAAFSGCGGGSDDGAQGVALAGESQVVQQPAGDAFAGRTVFETTCEVCHKLDDTQVGAGPNLAGLGLTRDAIRDQISNPRDMMPPDVVTGDEVDDVAAYLLTLQ